LRGLSSDDRPGYEEKVKEVCENIGDYWYWLEEGLQEWPSIHFGLEMALLDLKNEGQRIFYPSPFTQGDEAININGLIWMGEADFMQQQIREKLNAGFNCIKLKIGAIDFEQEIKLLKGIRQEFGADQIELRVDANGAFAPHEAMAKLKRLAELELHSIEQPIMAGQWNEMSRLCAETPLPIALDEELIGIFVSKEKERLIDTIRPQYIILKPSLVGGFAGSREWIDLAENRGIPWWITSALESNIGLNAIAQWTHTLKNPMPQGLGTGQLYTNNIPSPLEVSEGKLHFKGNEGWDIEALTQTNLFK
jgi:o-succinylbenzoate synthase